MLVALVVAEHVHHRVARDWFAQAARFATGHPRHEPWLDDLTYLEINLSGVMGHRQVTDAYLAGLTRRRGGRIATFDRGFAVVASDVAELISAQTRPQ